MKVNGIRSAADFAAEIERMVRVYKMDYLDALITYADRNGLEVETVASMVKQNSNLKTRLQLECEDANLVEKSASLPL